MNNRHLPASVTRQTKIT